MTEVREATFNTAQRAGLILGPAAAFALGVSPPPSTLSPEGWITAAIGAWMAIWWMTEAAPLAVTALLPLVAFPLLDAGTLEQTAASYAHPLIFLFLGGFLLARTMTVWRLDRRLALMVLGVSGANPRAVIAALMGVTAFLSMWISNTATTMVMLPIALSIAETFQPPDGTTVESPSTAMMLAIAYAATIGGMGTLIGTPPNAIFAAYMADSHGLQIGFGQWMLIGVPMVIVMLPAAWLILTRVTFKVDNAPAPRTAATIKKGHDELGPITSPEKWLTVIMIYVAAAWLLRPAIDRALPGLNLSDAGIALTGAILVFIVPVNLREGRFLLSWKEAIGIRWDVLILFGGGLALASAAGRTDLAQWLGTHLTVLSLLPVFVLLLAVGALMVFAGELASNTAMAAIFLPVASATAIAIGEPAMLLTLPVALFATLGFMLPVATPPNAIVFGSGNVAPSDMLRAGFLLNLVGILVAASMVFILGDTVFPAR